MIAERRSKTLQNAPRGAFCNTFDLHLTTIVFVLSMLEWPLKTGFTVYFVIVEVRKNIQAHTSRAKKICRLCLVQYGPQAREIIISFSE